MKRNFAMRTEQPLRRLQLSRVASVFILSALVILSLVSCSKSRKVLGAHETLWRQKDLLITYSCSAPPTEANSQRASSESFNMIPAAEESLEFATKCGIKLMLEHGRLTPSIANDPAKLDELAHVIDRVKNHPALECYYLYDEPKASDFPAVAKLVKFIRDRDPKHFSFVNMLAVHAVPGYAVPYQPGVDPSKTYNQFLKDYIEEVKPDLLSYDYYNFMRKPNGEAEDHGMYFVNLSLVRDVARAARIPFCNIIQSCTFDKTFRCPTESELRWQVYTTLAYGGRGISYFLYWGPKKYGGVYQDAKPFPPLLDPIVQLNNEMKALSPTLMKLNSTHVFNTEPIPTIKGTIPQWSPIQISSPGSFVLGLFAKQTKEDHFIVVNTNYRDAVVAKIHVTGKTVRAFDCGTASWTDVSLDSGDFSASLEPGGGKLFSFE
jgi:hypothetical protein